MTVHRELLRVMSMLMACHTSKVEIVTSANGDKIYGDEFGEVSEPGGQKVVSKSPPTSPPPLWRKSPNQLSREPPATRKSGPEERGGATTKKNDGFRVTPPHHPCRRRAAKAMGHHFLEETKHRLRTSWRKCTMRLELLRANERRIPQHCSTVNIFGSANKSAHPRVLDWHVFCLVADVFAVAMMTTHVRPVEICPDNVMS